MIKVLIVDDQTIFRESLKIILQQDLNIEVVGLAENGKEAVRLCECFNPDIVLMDIVMPVCNGIESTALIKEKCKDVKILMLTTMSDEKNTTEALQNGADGYVLKDIKPEHLIQAIKNLNSGLSIIQQSVMDTFKKSMVKKPGATEKDEPDSRISMLTNREKDVAKLIGVGKSNKEIGIELFISEGRARNIVSEVLQKLEFKDRVQLAIFAVKNKLV